MSTHRRNRRQVPRFEPLLPLVRALLDQNPDVTLWPTDQVARALQLPPSRATAMRVAGILRHLGLQHRRLAGEWLFVRPSSPPTQGAPHV